jgi:hypothetical protein
MSDFLLPALSVLEGIGRNIDLFGLMDIYNMSDREIGGIMLVLEGKDGFGFASIIGALAIL